MANSGLLTDWLGKGTHSARPASLDLPSNGVGIYYETDTGDAFAWDGTSWDAIGGGGGGGGTAYDSSIVAISSCTHYFACNDAPGATSLADTKGSLTGLALNGNVLLGAAPICQDLETTLCSPIAASGDNITLPTTLVSAAGPFTVEYWLDAQFAGPSSTIVMLSLDANKALDVYENTGNLKIQVNSTQYDSGIFLPSGRHHYVITYDSTTVKVYLDTVQMISQAASIPAFSGAGKLLQFGNGSDFNVPTARFGKLAAYNAVISGSQIKSNFELGNGL